MLVGLIKSLASVRDGLTLIAFLSLVLLVAFRTKKVPELVFGLVRDKLTRQQFYSLLNRFLTLVFIAFVALLILTVASQVLSHWTQPGALTVSDLRRELEKTKASDDQKTRAEAEYRLALEQLNQRNLDEGIAALRKSIADVPTLTAQEMLIYLNRQKGDFAGAAVAWEGAVKLARQRDDAVALARLDNTGVPIDLPAHEGETDLIGSSAPFPKGGEDYETAAVLSPGFFKCAEFCKAWYKLDLRTGSRLDIKFRSPPAKGIARITPYGTNGQFLKEAGDYGVADGGSIFRLEWVAADNGRHFLHTDAATGTVFRIRAN